MENQNLTIENFFLNDYAKVKEKKERLEEELLELKERQLKMEQVTDGFTDLKTPIKLVYVDTNLSRYYLFGDSCPLRDKTAEQLRELISKDWKELAEYLTELKTSSYSKALEVKERRFPFTLKFTTYKGIKVFAYDPDYSDEDLVKFCDDGAYIDCWVVSDFKDECIRYAVEKFTDEARERIAELESEDDAE